MGWIPCPKYNRDRVTDLWAGRKALSVGDILNLDITPNDRLWAVLREELFTEKQLLELSCRFIERTLPLWENWAEKNATEHLTAPRNCMAAVRDYYFNGNISFDKFSAAGKAAQIASVNASWDAAGNTAQIAAGNAARATAQAAIRARAINTARATAHCLGRTWKRSRKRSHGRTNRNCAGFLAEVATRPPYHHRRVSLNLICTRDGDTP